MTTRIEDAPTKSLTLPSHTTIDYREVGHGPTLVFVHGFLFDGLIWRNVIDRLSDRYRCIAPTRPLGSHRHVVPDTVVLGLDGVARIVADFLEAMELSDVTLIGNDSGGAVSQIVATRYGERVGRLVLTPCDAFDVCPPPSFLFLGLIPYLPGSVWAGAQLLRRRSPLRRLPWTYGAVAQLYSLLATLGTPQNVTLQELRIETWFPADDASERTLRQLQE